MAQRVKILLGCRMKLLSAPQSTAVLPKCLPLPASKQVLLQGPPKTQLREKILLFLSFAHVPSDPKILKESPLSEGHVCR